MESMWKMGGDKVDNINLKILKEFDEIDENIVISSGEKVSIYGYLIAYTLGKAYIPIQESYKIWTLRGFDIPILNSSDAIKKAISTYQYSEITIDNLKYILLITAKGKKKNVFLWELSLHSYDINEPQKLISHCTIGHIKCEKINNEYIITEAVLNSEKTDIPSNQNIIDNLGKMTTNNNLSKLSRFLIDTITNIVLLSNTLKTHINNDSIRDYITKRIKENGGIPFSAGRGGTWFIPYKKKEFVMNLRDAIKESRPYAHNKFDIRIIPVVKEEDLRKAIIEDAEEYAKQSLKNILIDTYNRIKKAKDENEAEAIISDATERKIELLGILDEYNQILSAKIQTMSDTVIPTDLETHPVISDRIRALLHSLAGGE